MRDCAPRRFPISRAFASLVLLLAAVSCSSSEPAAGNGATSDGSQGAFRILPVGKRQAAPALSGAPISGSSLNLQQLRGDIVVIKFWASWCGPCRAESPILEGVLKRTSTHQVAFLGVDEKDSRAAAISFTHDQRVTYPSIFDPDGTLAAAWPAAGGLPYTFILDRTDALPSALSEVSHSSSSSRPGLPLGRPFWLLGPDDVWDLRRVVYRVRKAARELACSGSRIGFRRVAHSQFLMDTWSVLELSASGVRQP